MHFPSVYISLSCAKCKRYVAIVVVVVALVVVVVVCCCINSVNASVAQPMDGVGVARPTKHVHTHKHINTHTGIHTHTHALRRLSNSTLKL